MRAVSPIVAITILLLMAIAAAALAFLTLTNYQTQVEEAGQGGLEALASNTATLLRIESVAEGDILLRNLGSRTYLNAKFFLDGKPLETSGPNTCPSGNICTFLVNEEELDCSGTHKLGMGRGTGVIERTVTCCDLGFCAGDNYTISLEAEESWTTGGYMQPVSLVVVNGSGPKLAVFVGLIPDVRVFNKTGGEFELENDTVFDYSGVGAYSLAAGDLDDDGTSEIVADTGADLTEKTNLTVFNYTTPNLLVENFTELTGLMHTSKFVHINDIDDDSALELVDMGYQYSFPYTLYVNVWNYSDSTLIREGPATAWVWYSSYDIHPPNAHSDDIDDDGDTELIMNRADCLNLCGYDPCCLGHLSIASWNGTFFSEEYNNETIGHGDLYTDSADVDGDSQTELLVIGSLWDGSKYVIYLQILRWNGSTMTLEHEETWSDTQSSYGRQVKAGDVDGDGNIEIVTAATMTTDRGGYGEVRTWYWDGAALQLESATEVGTSAHEYVPWAMRLYDIDGDSVLEIMTFGENFDDFILQAWSAPQG